MSATPGCRLGSVNPFPTLFHFLLLLTHGRPDPEHRAPRFLYLSHKSRLTPTDIPCLSGIHGLFTEEKTRPMRPSAEL